MLDKEQIPAEYKKFMDNYNPSTEIGTTEFMIFTTLGMFRKRGATIWHCIMELYNEKKDFSISSYQMARNSNQKVTTRKNKKSKK